MPQEPRDDLDHDLFEPALDRLYLKELTALGGESCRNLLGEMIADRWKSLVRHSCRQRQSPTPDHQDALHAFDALKHAFFSKEVHLLNLSLPEIWRAIQGLSLRAWLLIGSIALPVLTAITCAAYWLGAHFGK